MSTGLPDSKTHTDHEILKERRDVCEEILGFIDVLRVSRFIVRLSRLQSTPEFLNHPSNILSYAARICRPVITPQ